MRWAVLLVLLGVAQATPTVEVRAHTQLSIGRVKLIDSGVEVTGHLNDKLTGAGIGRQPVRITLDGIARTSVTDETGAFSEVFPSEGGTVEVTLAYGGSSRLEKSVPLTVKTDPSKSQVELAIAKTVDDPQGIRLRVTATGEDGPTALLVEISVADPGSEEFKPVRTVTTGPSATSAARSGEEVLLTRREAGGAGIHRLRAVFAGDDTRQAAQGVVTIEITTNTQTTMSLSSTKLAYEDDLIATGRVIDDDQQPIAHAAVALVSGDKRLAQTTTDNDGRYRFSIEAEILGQGQFGIQVQADPGRVFVKSSRSQPEIVRIAPAQPVPVSYTIAAFIATVLSAGGFFAARSKPWLRLRRPARPAEVPSEEGEIDVQHGGLVVAKPSIVSTLRRPHDDSFSGVVRDTVRGRPVADASVRLTFGDLVRSLQTADDGSFVIEQLEPGEWRADVTAPGFVTESFAVTIPHRGELRGVRIDLVPVRERVFQLYRRAAEPVLPETRLWGIWSPRQIVDHVRAKRPSPALAELTDFVEEVYFSPRVVGEAVLPQASEHVDRAIQERARPRA